MFKVGDPVRFKPGDEESARWGVGVLRGSENSESQRYWVVRFCDDPEYDFEVAENRLTLTCEDQMTTPSV